jgi:hypothetical protein
MTIFDHAAFRRRSGEVFRTEPHKSSFRVAALRRVEMLAQLFDPAFMLPSTNVRLGIEAILRLMPASATLQPLRCLLTYCMRPIGSGCLGPRWRRWPRPS